MLRPPAWLVGLRDKAPVNPMLTLIGAAVLVAPLVAVTPHTSRGGVTNHWVEEGVPCEMAAAALLVAALWRVCNTYDLRDAWAFARRGPMPLWILLFAWATLTCVLSAYKGFAIQGLVQLASVLLVPALVAYQVRHGRQMRTLLSVFCAAAILAAFQGILVLLQAEPGTGVAPASVHGLFGVVQVLPLLFVFSLASHGHWLRVLARIAAFLGVVALLVAHASVCWPGVLASGAALCLLLPHHGLMKGFLQGEQWENPHPFRALEQNWIDNRPVRRTADLSRPSERRRRSPRSGRDSSRHSSSQYAGREDASEEPAPAGDKRTRLLYSLLHTLTVLGAFVLFLFLTHTLNRAVLGVHHSVEAAGLFQHRMQQDWAEAVLALDSRRHSSLHGGLGGLHYLSGVLLSSLGHYWRGPARMIAARPISGWGIGCYALYQMPFTHIGRPAMIVNGYGPWQQEQARNLYVRLSAELGLPGLALWVGALVLVFRGGLRRLRLPHTDPLRVRVLVGGLAVLCGQAVDVFADPAWMFGRASLFACLVLGMTLAASGITEDLPTATAPTRPEGGHWLMTTQRGRYLRFVAVCFLGTVVLALLVEAIIG